MLEKQFMTALSFVFFGLLFMGCAGAVLGKTLKYKAANSTVDNYQDTENWIAYVTAGVFLITFVLSWTYDHHNIAAVFLLAFGLALGAIIGFSIAPPLSHAESYAAPLSYGSLFAAGLAMFIVAYWWLGNNEMHNKCRLEWSNDQSIHFDSMDEQTMNAFCGVQKDADEKDVQKAFFAIMKHMNHPQSISLAQALLKRYVRNQISRGHPIDYNLTVDVWLDKWLKMVGTAGDLETEERIINEFDGIARKLKTKK